MKTKRTKRHPRTPRIKLLKHGGVTISGLSGRNAWLLLWVLHMALFLVRCEQRRQKDIADQKVREDDEQAAKTLFHRFSQLVSEVSVGMPAEYSRWYWFVAQDLEHSLARQIFSRASGGSAYDIQDSMTRKEWLQYRQQHDKELATLAELSRKTLPHDEAPDFSYSKLPTVVARKKFSDDRRVRMQTAMADPEIG